MSTTTTRRQKRQIELYAEGFALVEKVAEHVRGLNARYRMTDDAAKHAVKLNQAAYTEASNAVTVLRALVAALSDSAGHSETFDLAECVNRARELVG